MNVHTAAPAPAVAFGPFGSGAALFGAPAAGAVQVRNEQALVSLKLKKSVDAEGGRTLAVMIEVG